jgi:hypothetical protein
MNKKVWIFGDSYASRENDKNTWPAKLEDIYKVVNFSKSGSGVDWSLQQMIDAAKVTDTKDITAIFFLTEQNRHNWNFWKDPGEQWISKHLAVESKIPKIARPTAKTYKQYISFARAVYKFQDDNFESRSIIKSIGAINLYASNFEKILIWPCFDNVLLNCKLNKNVTIASPCMSDFESVADNMSLLYAPNHLSERKHKEMLQILIKWIDTNEF